MRLIGRWLGGVLACKATGFALLFVFARLVHADGLVQIELAGLKGEQADNVRATVTLFQLDVEERADLPEGRLGWLIRKTPNEVRKALEPFGYYTPTVDVQLLSTMQGAKVMITVTRGVSTKLRQRSVVVDGEASDDARIQKAITAFKPSIGKRFVHSTYSRSKAHIESELAAHGYFDAELLKARVEVTRADSAADVDLHWQSGRRYRFGPLYVDGSHIDARVLTRALGEPTGQPYDVNVLLGVHQRLTDLDYFGLIDIQPQIEMADGDQVPVTVDLSPSRRTIYSAGLSYGTDSGAGVLFGLDRRWVNARGHKWSNRVQWSQVNPRVDSTYRMPAYRWFDGWYFIGLGYREESTDSVENRIGEAVVGRDGRFGEWTLGASLHALRERYLRARSLGDYATALLVYPALQANRVHYDDPLYARKGFSLSGEIRVGSDALWSDFSFAQVLGSARWVRGWGEQGRVIARGQFGRTFGGNLQGLPTSLRFYAGGDRSVRGYAYQEISPEDAVGDPIGGRNLLVGSLEYEHMFDEQWGMAGFVDAGNAFNDVSEGLRIGIGTGLRWRSPIGPVRVDVGHGLDDPKRGWQLHIGIGPER
jgi:translocation and assembly module TamA